MMGCAESLPRAGRVQYSVSSLARMTRPSGSGTLRQARLCQVPLRGTRALSPPSQSCMMGGMSSLAHGTRQCASGTLTQARPTPGPLRGTRAWSPPLHSRMMGSVLSQAHGTTQSRSGMLRQARLCRVPLRGTHTMSPKSHSRAPAPWTQKARTRLGRPNACQDPDYSHRLALDETP